MGGCSDLATLKQRLADPRPLLAVELRPPRTDLQGVRAMEAWIDVYHAVQRLSRADTLVFVTDNAVGASEEENLNHLDRNLGGDAVRERIVPFLTLKHALDYCLRYAERARRASFPGLVVLGGDRHDGIPRCLDHAWRLRERLRNRHANLLLGAWANPYRDADEQVSFLLDHRAELDIVLTQVVSHHRLGDVARFLETAQRRGMDAPIFAGVFFYRSGRRATLRMLGRFLPVPEEEIVRDFTQRGLTAEQVAARTVIELGRLGLRRFYLSNLETGRAEARLQQIAELAGLANPLANGVG